MADKDIISRKVVAYRVLVVEVNDVEQIQQEWKILTGSDANPESRGYVDRVVRTSIDRTAFEQTFLPKDFDLKKLVAAANGLT